MVRVRIISLISIRYNMNLSCLCMMPVSTFVSCLGITDLNWCKLKIYTNLIKLFHFEIYITWFLFKSSISILIIFGNNTILKIFIIAQRKLDESMHVFLQL